MREIKFRVWDTKNKIWINDFCLLNWGHYKPILISEALDKSIKHHTKLCPIKYKDTQFGHGSSGIVTSLSTEPYGSPVELEDCIIQQYTGLKDENGKEIYEGDILDLYIDWTDDFKASGTVIFEEGQFVIADSDFNDSWTRRYNWKNSQIVGNVFENPELL